MISMAKRRRKDESDKKSLLAEGYTECPSCSQLVKPGSKRCEHCGAFMPTTKKIVVAIAIVTMIIIASTLAYVFSFQNPNSSSLPCVVDYSPKGMGVLIGSKITVTFCQPMNTDSVEQAFYFSPAVAGDHSWLNDTALVFTPLSPFPKGTIYMVTIDERAKNVEGRGLDSSIFRWHFTTESGAPTNEIPTKRGIGTGANNFWIGYPSSHPSVGQIVSHPSFASASLEKGVVMILDHSVGCAPCVQQVAICNAVSSSHSSDLTYFDLTSGTNEPQASQVFAAYDPTGGVNYIPLTVILTKVQDSNGNVAIGWHSWEGVVDQATLESWISDALSYFEENA